jgi:aminopeptidase-like protein
MSTAIKHKVRRSEQSLFSLCEQLFPICRSITGNGVRETLSILQEYIDLEIFEIPTDKKVLDWTVPKEWNVREAWIKNSKGETIVDFRNNNLHLLSYSVPVHGKIDLASLKDHLYTLPEQPDLIPYRTSYYKENWGFCLSHNQYQQLEDDTYEVFIDSTLKPGSLTYGELYIPGEIKEELLFSAHTCHPSLANDNCSGVSVLTHLARYLLTRRNRFSYRIIFIPGTIGSITWLSENQNNLDKIKGGLVASLLGDAGDFTYKKSRRGNTEMDFVVQYVLTKLGLPFRVQDFIPYGYDERQFCAPAFNLPMGNLTRSQFGTYPEYHTSGDNLQLVRQEYLEASFEVYREVVHTFESHIFYQNLFPEGEPQLGKRGLYSAIGGNSEAKQLQMAMLWILNYSDGDHSLIHIARLAGMKYRLLEQAGNLLKEKGVIKKI